MSRPGDDDKIRITPANACRFAIEEIQRAGFVHVCDSMQSEATYWKLPGLYGVLRVATHGKRWKHPPARSGQRHHGPTIASVTFPKGSARPDGFLYMTEGEIENIIAFNVGLYFMRAERRSTEQVGLISSAAEKRVGAELTVAAPQRPPGFGL